MKGEFSLQKAEKNDNKCWVIIDEDHPPLEGVVIQKGIKLEDNHSLAVLVDDGVLDQQYIWNYDDKGVNNSEEGGSYLENIPVLKSVFKINYTTAEGEAINMDYQTFAAYKYDLDIAHKNLLERHISGLYATAQEIWE